MKALNKENRFTLALGIFIREFKKIVASDLKLDNPTINFSQAGNYVKVYRHLSGKKYVCCFVKFATGEVFKPKQCIFFLRPSRKSCGNIFDSATLTGMSVNKKGRLQ